MKIPFKASLYTASIGMLIYLSSVVVSLFKPVRIWICTLPYRRELYGDCVVMILLFSIALACLTLYVNRGQMPKPDKSLRLLTNIAALTTVFILVNALISYFYTVGEQLSLFTDIDYWARIILTVLAVISLWKMGKMPLGEESLPKSFSIALLAVAICSIIVVGLILLAASLELISSHSIGGGLGTFAYWRYGLVPTVLFPWYAVINIKKGKETAKNQFCIKRNLSLFFKRLYLYLPNTISINYTNRSI